MFFLVCSGGWLVGGGGWGGVINIIFVKFIALVVCLGSWGLVVSIITLKFLQDYHPFLLETIRVSGLGLFPFQAHLKLT